jgi:hypothetical protein
VDSEFCAGAAALWCGGLSRWCNRGSGAAMVARRGLARRRYGGMVSRTAFDEMLLEGVDMGQGSG